MFVVKSKFKKNNWGDNMYYRVTKININQGHMDEVVNWLDSISNRLYELEGLHSINCVKVSETEAYAFSCYETEEQVHKATAFQQEVFGEMAKYIHENSNCKVLWASCRMSYDFILAQKCNADIITMSPNLAKKMALFEKNPLEYSKDTVKGFFDDAKSSGFVF